MPASYILALDQGTSSSRALVVDGGGRIVASGQRELPRIYPQPGWVEQDPEAIWRTQLDAAQEALATAGLEARAIAAIGITNQRETVVLWERDGGRPLANAIVWQCRRTAAECDELRARGAEPTITERTGLVIDPYFSGTKIAWLLDHIPSARARAAAGELACGTVDSWLLSRLTGGRLHVTDHTNASRTMLYNLETNAWDDELCRLLRVPREILPEIQPSSGVFGETDAGLFGTAIPLRGIAGDQQAALYGQACFTDGATKNTYGTGCFALRHTGDRLVPARNGLLATAAASTGDTRKFALEGSIFVAGAAVQWLRDGLGIIEKAAEIEGLAGSVADSGGVQIVPAFTGLGAPHWDPYARGLIAGITQGTTAAHLARATLEAIAFQTREVVELLDREANTPGSELRVDGGAAQNDLLLHIQADLLGRTVVRPVYLETTALGAAFLAGLSAGIWPNEEAIASLWRAEKRFEPRIDRAERDERYALWSRAVALSRGWAAPTGQAAR